jgi:hypothetical protein
MSANKHDIGDVEKLLIAAACGLKIYEIANGCLGLSPAEKEQLLDTVLKNVSNQIRVLCLKYSSTLEQREAIDNELKKISIRKAVEDLHKILGINQIDESNHMQFGDKTLAELTEGVVGND